MLATVGIIVVFLGMIPVMFMKAEPQRSNGDQAAPLTDADAWSSTTPSHPASRGKSSGTPQSYPRLDEIFPGDSVRQGGIDDLAVAENGSVDAATQRAGID